MSHKFKIHEYVSRSLWSEILILNDEHMNEPNKGKVYTIRTIFPVYLPRMKVSSML